MIYRGLLDAQLAHWYRYFPRSSFCLVAMSALHNDTAAAAVRIASFFGVTDEGDRGWTRVPVAEQVVYPFLRLLAVIRRFSMQTVWSHECHL